MSNPYESRTMAIPNPVYEYIRGTYGGDAAGPCAVYQSTAGTYTLHQETVYPSYATFVVARLDGTRISLSNLPNTVTCDWDLL